MTRRTLIKYFGITATGLFVPTKTIFLAPIGGWRTSGYAMTIEEHQNLMRILGSQMDEAFQKFEREALEIIGPYHSTLK